MAATVTTNIVNLARQACTACHAPSFTTKSKTYEVRDAFTPLATCTCDDFRYRRQSALGDDRACKHVLFTRGAVNQMLGLVRDLRDMIDDPLVSV